MKHNHINSIKILNKSTSAVIIAFIIFHTVWEGLTSINKGLKTFLREAHSIILFQKSVKCLNTLIPSSIWTFKSTLWLTDFILGSPKGSLRDRLEALLRPFPFLQHYVNTNWPSDSMDDFWALSNIPKREKYVNSIKEHVS